MKTNAIAKAGSLDKLSRELRDVECLSKARKLTIPFDLRRVGTQ